LKSFSASIRIRASAETVWALLTDAAGYPEWNSTVARIAGQIAPGSKIVVHARAAPGRGFPVRVTAFQPPQLMEWTGGMPLGLFTGRRRFTVSPAGAGELEFAMREEFGGPLAPLISPAIPDQQPAFTAFAADLKRQAEAR